MKHYTLGLYEKAMPNALSMAEKLHYAKQANYDYLEICVDASEEKIARIDMPKAERLAIVQAAMEAGVSIDSVSVSALTKYALGDLDETISQRGLTILKGSIQLAKDLGIRYIMVPGYDIYFGESNADTEAKFVKNLKIAVEFAAQLGVVLAFETMENAFMNTVTKARHYVDLIDSPFLMIYPDAGNVTNAVVEYGTDIVADFEAGAGKIVATHLKESRPGVFREVPYGTGHVDFKTVIHTAYRLGVRKFVTEFWDIGKENWFEDLTFANQTMRGYLDQEETTC